MTMNLNPRVTFFNQGQFELMKARVFELLDRRGVRMDHPEVLQLLGQAGARVDADTNVVRFPGAFLEAQLRQVPEKVTLAGRTDENTLTVPCPDGTFCTRTNTGGQSWIGLESGRHRPVTAADVATWARLADRLEHIDFCAFPVPGDVPAATLDVHALSLMLKNTEKHIWVQPYTRESVAYLIELAQAAAGGADVLQAHPPVSFITCSLTPLDFKAMDLEIILQCARRGIPLHACSLPGAGATAPVTMPGAVLLATAEILAMVAAAQVVQPATPVIAAPLIFSTDMMSGRSLQSSVESMQGAGLAIQFIRAAFGLPTHTYGIGSDSPVLDGQCTSEGALRCMTMALSGADILGGAGQLEVATTISPVQLAIDNEVLGMVKRMVSKIDFDDETMAWQELSNAQPGSQFLSNEHTFRHCRDGLMPLNFIRMTRDGWHAKGEIDLKARVSEYCKGLLAQAEPVALPENTARELDSVVSRADTNLQ
jgi:trimethylamine:corrinoid methyltransferase-like protein